MRPSLVLLTVASFLAMVLVLLPLPNHWRARNLPTLCVIFWLFFLNLVHFINANIWNENTIPRALVYCDISQKLVVGASIGVHAACFCIIRQLESIASGRTGIQTAKDRTRRRIIDGLICIGCPVLTMVLHYVVQGHRFDILEDFGCMFHAYWSWPTMVIINLPPLLLSLAGFVYGGFTVYWFLQRRSQFNDLLTSSNSGVTRSRYLRLMGLAFTEMTILTAAELSILITNFQVHPFFPYVSWSYVHEDFGRIEQYAHVLLTKNYISQMFLVWWLAPVGALCFFVFFGTGDEAISDYMLIVDFVRVKVLRMKPRQPKVSQYSTGHMPSIKLPKGFSQGPVESYDLEAKWPGDSALGLDSPTSPSKDKDREAAPAYAYSSKRADATVSKLSVPVSMTDGSFGRISPTATQYTVSDRASVALSYDERADVDADDLDGDVDHIEAVAPQQGRTSTSTSTPAPAPTRPSFSK